MSGRSVRFLGNEICVEVDAATCNLVITLKKSTQIFFEMYHNVAFSAKHSLTSLSRLFMNKYLHIRCSFLPLCYEEEESTMKNRD